MYSFIWWILFLFHLKFKFEEELFFFYKGFISRTLKIHRTAWEGRGPSIIPLYHFDLLTNTHTFICNFAREMTITYIKSHGFYLPDCYSRRVTTLLNYYLIDWWCDVDFRFLACRFDFRFCYNYLTLKTGGQQLASTIFLVLQVNWLTKCASHHIVSI